MTTQSLKKIDSISALRAFAALYVATTHLHYITTPQAQAPAWLIPFIAFGGVGVTLFFVLSAFTLCLSSDARKGEPSPLISFYIRRFFRIAPLLYLWIVLSMIRRNEMYGHSFSLKEILLNVSFGFNFVPGFESGIALASWSIGVEMIFYLIFPGIFKLAKTIPRSLALLALSLLISHLWGKYLIENVADQPELKPFHYSSFLNQLPVFMIGIVAYRIYLPIKTWKYVGYLGAALLILSSAALLACAYGYVQAWQSIYMWAGLCSGVMLGVIFFPIRILVNRVTSYLGEISYSVYLAHTSGCYFAQLFITQIYQDLSLFWGFVVSYLVMLAVVIPFSALTYRYVETPGNRGATRLIDWLRSNQSQRVAPSSAHP